MKVFAIGDLHLSFSKSKPMSIFGPEWENHEDKIAQRWRADVACDDVVLIPGDISWATRPQEAAEDLAWIHALPGRKFFIQGNHDYWCSQTGKVKKMLPPSLALIRCSADAVSGVGICGTRGWLRPDQPEFNEETDRALWEREINRLRLSLDALRSLDPEVSIAMIHFQPRSAERSSPLSDLLEAAGVRHCVYGHVHAGSFGEVFEGAAGGVVYRCVSADYLGFAPALILES